MKRSYLKLSLLLLAILSLSLQLSAEDRGTTTVRGRIIDKGKEPIPAIAVGIDGTPMGGYSNDDGTFVIPNVPTGSHSIVVSGMGIKTVTIPVQLEEGREYNLREIEVDEDTFQLNEVSVTAKSEARLKQEQAYAISVLDIKKSYTSSAPLSKVLNTVSSVRIREDGGMGSTYNFSLNGFSGNQVKFFLDGIPMDNFGSSYNLSNISANMAERVEVYKGVLPVSLGADALGGAVNLVTRKDANYIDASYSFGSFNTHKADINGAYTNLKTGFTVRANAFYNHSDNNYKVFVPIIDLATNQKIDERWVNRFHDKYWSAGLRLETGIVNKSFADYLLFGIIASKNDNQLQTGATMDAVYGGVKVKSESLIPSIRYKKDDLFIDGLSLSLYGSYGSVNSFNIDTLSRKYNWLGEYVPTTKAGEAYLTNSRIENREWLGTANLNYVINTNQSVTLNHILSSVGRSINDKAHPNDPMNNIPQRLTKNITGLGWQIRYDRWNANVFGKMYQLHSSTLKRLDEYTDDARWEEVSDNKTNFGYGAAATYYILPSLQAKLSYEQAYRLPESIEMFGDGLIQQRNPDLKPESSQNINLGLSFDKFLGAQHRLSAEANLIYRDTKDFILKGVSLTSNPTTGYDNIGKVLTKGVEAGVRYRYNDWFHIGGAFTYQDIIDNQEFEKNEGSFVGEGITENITYKERLPNIPYLFANGYMGFEFKNVGMEKTRLTVDYSMGYIHQYYLSFPGLGAKATKKVIPEQLSHDIAIGYTLDNGKYGIMLECTNLTDEKLYDNYRLQKPGRAFNIKFRYFLSK